MAFSITDWYSAVGMFLRDASSWVMVPTVLGDFLFAIYGWSLSVAGSELRIEGNI